jgi:hypothetical protein
MRALWSFALSLPLLLLGANVHAQDSEDLSTFTIDEGDTRVVEFDVTFASAVTGVSIGFTGDGTPGVEVLAELIDADTILGNQGATLTDNIDDEEADSWDLEITGDYAAGTHRITLALIYEDGAVPSVVANGVVTVSTGSISIVNEETVTEELDRANIYGKSVEYFSDDYDEGTYRVIIETDIGATAQNVNFVLDGEGDALEELRLYTVVGGTRTLQTLTPNTTFDIEPGFGTVNTSGTLLFEIEWDVDDSTDDAEWFFFVSSNAAIQPFGADEGYGMRAELSRGTEVIEDGDTDNIATSTDGVQLDLTYTIENMNHEDGTITFGTPAVSTTPGTGNPTVNIGSGSPANGSTVAFNDSANIVIEVTPDGVGPWTVDVVIHNSGLPGGMLEFTISGDAAAATAPELEVTRGSDVIANGGTDTVFGTVDSTLTTVTYVLENVGNGDLTFSDPSVTHGTPNNASVDIDTAPAGNSSLTPTSTTNLIIEITPDSDGAWSVEVTIHNDGSLGDEHVFTISGTAQSTADPIIAVSRAGTGITNGGTDAIVGDTGTDPFNLIYTITNQGAGNLELTGTTDLVEISAEDNCTVTVTSDPDDNIASGGGTTTFTIQVTPDEEGAFSFSVSIPNNDTLFEYTVSGETGTVSSGSSSSSDDSCSTGEQGGLSWLALAALLAMLGLARNVSIARNRA